MTLADNECREREIGGISYLEIVFFVRHEDYFLTEMFERGDFDMRFFNHFPTGGRFQTTVRRRQLSDSQRLLAFNDFFIGARRHISAQYRIEHNKRSEIHGVFEIPSILIAGQAGFYLARLLLHRREDRNVRQSMREWLVLVAGLAMMLVWAGIMEAFFLSITRQFCMDLRLRLPQQNSCC